MQDLRRAATILFSFVYLMATSGILVGQHRCMGRVKNARLFQKTEKKCVSGEQHEGLMPCCEDTWSLEKVEDDQQASSFKKAPDTRYHLLYAITFSELIVNPAGSQEEELEVNDTGPPDLAPTDLNILFHNLKIPVALQS